MSSSMPIVRQQKVLYLIFQIIIIVLLSLPFYFVDRNNSFLYGLVLFLLIFYSLRTGIPRFHRKGVYYYKNEKFQEAIECFEKSYIFFKKHKWIDKYRMIVLLSSSSISYTEMAKNNIAFCLGQIGKKEESIATYRQVLLEFPNNKMAEAALRMLE